MMSTFHDFLSTKEVSRSRTCPVFGEVAGGSLRHLVLLRQAFRTAFVLLFLCLGILGDLKAADTDALARREWKLNGVVREALVHVPSTAKTNGAPVVFAFHGHGGSMSNAARMFSYEKVWPEAIVVYMQGLNTPGRLTDLEGKLPGWQFRQGDHDDRDLKFFDAVVDSLKRDYKVDARRLYSTGHSNGGAFTYLLWQTRADQLAAFAPSAAIFVDAAGHPGRTRDGVNRPVLHVAGENDPLVKFEWQKQMIAMVKKLNQCDQGQPWDQDKRCTFYKSAIKCDVVTYIHQAKHGFPSEVPGIVVKFFKQQMLP
jgi:polyhydroxybutyrate depolymerase